MNKFKWSPLIFIGLLLIVSMILIVAEKGVTKEETMDYTSTGESIIGTFDHNGTNREYILYLPDGQYKDAALVFVLHGYTSSAEIIQSYSGFNDLADINDFVVCYPQGLEDRYGTTHWNANLNMSEVDDVGYMTALSDYIVDTYHLDSQRVFTCGMSNGGFMSYTLAMEAQDTFKAIASVTGVMSGFDWTNRENAEPIPVLHIHGEKDPVVPIDGSMSLSGGWGGADPVADIVSFWSEVNQCTQTMEETDQEGLYVVRYTNGIDNNEVWYYQIADMGHEWPLTENNWPINASEEIWDFFSKY